MQSNKADLPLPTIARYLVTIVAIATTFGCSSDRDIRMSEEEDFSGASVSIVPRPSEVNLGKGQFAISGQTVIRVSDPSLALVGRHLSDALKVHLGDAPRLVMPGEDAPHHADRTIDLVATKPGARGASDEAYSLDVDSRSVRIAADSAAGVFYGVQSLLQLVPRGAGPADEIAIPCLSIEDNPRYTWRGMHLDVCRHFMPVTFVKKYIDLLAMHKMNRFHWHLTEDQGWRVEIEAFPLLTEVSAWRTESGRRHGGYYTKDEIREIVKYAADRFITVVPEIEMPGHARAALAAYPKLSCTGGPFEVATTWGVFEDVFCAGNDKTFDFLETVLGEILELFPSQMIHIGGDECPKARWKSCARCQSRMKAKGLHDEEELQSYFVKRIADFLESKGRTLVGWDEIVEGGLARNAVVMSWRGIEPGLKAASEGHRVIMTPTSHCYFDYRQLPGDDEPGAKWAPVLSLEKVYGFDPTAGVEAASARNVLGVQGNVWTETMATPERVEYMAVPRMCAMAEVAWSGGAKDFEDFRARLTAHAERLDAMNVHYCKTMGVGREQPD
ncbi:MAG: beta-N-acetylhexosaminidase [Planctomycetota bacterium]|jgi:hexosaminidase